MKCVIVVGTVHEERGLANVAGLLAILEDIRPEVIFVEAPTGELDKYFSEAGPKLESAAVREYSVGRAPILFPVDLPTPPSEYFRQDGELHHEIELRSPEYCRAADEHFRLTSQHGFDYLNSTMCASLAADLHSAMRGTLRTLNQPELDERYELSLSTLQRRDEAMFANIQRFSDDASYSTAVLLVGAAHRPGLMRLASAHSMGEPTLTWQFAAPSPDFSLSG